MLQATLPNGFALALESSSQFDKYFPMLLWHSIFKANISYWLENMKQTLNLFPPGCGEFRCRSGWARIKCSSNTTLSRGRMLVNHELEEFVLRRKRILVFEKISALVGHLLFFTANARIYSTAHLKRKRLRERKVFRVRKNVFSC